MCLSSLTTSLPETKYCAIDWLLELRDATFRLVSIARASILVQMAIDQFAVNHGMKLAEVPLENRRAIEARNKLDDCT